jgi:hypothetical protein
MASLKELALLSIFFLQAFPVGAAPAPSDGYRALTDHNPLHVANIKPCAGPDDCEEGNEQDDKGDEGGHGDENGNKDVGNPTTTITDW